MASVSGKEVALYLSKRLGAKVTVLNLRQTFPGISRETLLVKADVGGEMQDFALRLDHSWGGSCPFPLRHEWETYLRLWRSPVPVAEPLWFDEGIEFGDGRAHLVRRLVDGSTQISGLSDPTPEGAALRRRVALECAEKLALVHALDWKAYGFDSFMTPPADPPDALRHELRTWRDIWKRGRPEPEPLIEEALAWLEEALPRETPRISLTKGNNGVGEEIWQGDRIVALSDWELSALGDGMLDFAFSQGTLTLGDFGETLRHYEQFGGAPVSPARLAGAAFVTWFKQYVCETTYMGDRHVAGIDRRIQMLTFGTVIARATAGRLARCIGRDLVSVWSELVGAERSSYFRVMGAA